MQNISVKFDSKEAVNGLSLTVEPGRCHALLGRNGAGKTTAIKALLGLLRTRCRSGAALRARPAQARGRGEVSAGLGARLARLLPVDERSRGPRPRGRVAHQLAKRRRRAPGLTLRTRAGRPTSGLSKGQKTQLVLTCAVAADPELLVLDEPTTGLDPLVRRQFLEAVIGTFQDRNPQAKTILVSTHLISEFEGIIDDFTVMAKGRAVITSDADSARQRFCRLRGWFEQTPPLQVPVSTITPPKTEGRLLELVVAEIFVCAA